MEPRSDAHRPPLPKATSCPKGKALHFLLGRNGGINVISAALKAAARFLTPQSHPVVHVRAMTQVRTDGAPPIYERIKKQQEAESGLVKSTATQVRTGTRLLPLGGFCFLVSDLEKFQGFASKKQTRPPSSRQTNFSL